MTFVIDGDILMTYAIFRFVIDVTNEDMWQITVQSTPYPSQKLATLTQGLTWKTMTSISLWMMNERLRNVEPGAQVY